MFLKTLFITRYFPYPKHTGALMWSSMLIEMFSKLSVSVEILCQAFEEEENEWIGQHNSYHPNCTFYVQKRKKISSIKRVLTVLPNASVTHNITKNHELLEALLERKPKLIVIDHIGSVWALKAIQKFKEKKHGTSVLYCAHNYEYDTRRIIAKEFLPDLFNFAIHLIDALKIRFADRKIFSFINMLITSANKDRKNYLTKYKPQNAITILPVYEKEILNSRDIDKKVSRKICIVGSFIWSAKKLDLEKFLHTACERLRRNCIELVVVGKMEQAYIEKLRTIWPNVEFTGVVNKIEPFLKECRIGVLPEVPGGGFQWKAMEYIFNRLPIFTIEGAVADLPVTKNGKIAAFPNREKLVDGIIYHIDNFQLLNHMQNESFSACKGFIDIEDRVDSLKNALNKKGMIINQ